jgi:hypothetical protein
LQAFHAGCLHGFLEVLGFDRRVLEWLKMALKSTCQLGMRRNGELYLTPK